MSIALKIVLFVLLLPIGAGIIYRSLDRVYATVVQYPSATGKDICMILGTLLALAYCGLLVWYFFIG